MHKGGEGKYPCIYLCVCRVIKEINSLYLKQKIIHERNNMSYTVVLETRRKLYKETFKVLIQL